VKRIVGVAVEHDGQSVFGTPIPTDLSEEHALQKALMVIHGEVRTAPGKVTRVWFDYEDDDE
jgi:hypothetical protein